MNTRSLFGLILFLFTSPIAFGQARVNSAIKSKLDSFIDHSNAKQWDQAFDLIYPKLFGKVPKQDLVDLMTSMDQDGLTMKVENTGINSYSDPLAEGSETFVRFTYTSDIVVRVEKGGLYDAPKPIQAMDQQFKAIYGGRSVLWNADQKQFNIRATKSMMAIDPGNGDWKLVEINMDQPELMEYLFSPSVMEALVRTEETK